MARRTDQTLCIQRRDVETEAEAAQPSADWDTGVYPDEAVWEAALRRHCSDAKLDGVETEMILLHSEGVPLEAIRRQTKYSRNGVRGSLRDVRIALERSIRKLEGRLPGFGQYASDWRRQLIFAFTNKSGREMPELPAIVADTPLTRLPQGAPIVTAEDVRVPTLHRLQLWAQNTRPVLVPDVSLYAPV